MHTSKPSRPKMPVQGPPRSRWSNREALTAELREELALVALAALLAVGGLAAILYVVYTAPLLLAEVALDAALVSSVYRRLRRRDAGHWGVAVLRRTWVPATMMILFVTAAGFMLQHVFPDARSLGDVVRAGLGGR